MLDAHGQLPVSEAVPASGVWRERAAFAGLLLWAAGALANEGVATVGMVSTVMVVTADALSRRSWRTDVIAFVRGWWPLLAFVGWAALAPLVAGRWPTGAGLARLADWLAIPVAARASSLLTERNLARLALASGAVFLASCVVAGLQHFGAWPPLEAFAPLEWTRIPFGRVYEPAPGAEGRFMGGGLLFHRLKFAHTGGLAVAFALALALFHRGRARAFALAVAVIGFGSVLVFPLARMAAAAMALAVAAVLVASHRRRKLGALLAAAALVVAAAASALSPTMRARFFAAATTEGSGARTMLLKAGARAVAEHPIAGVGLGRFRPALHADAQTPRYVLENPGKAHNQLLSIAAEVGVIGALLFAATLVLIARRLRVDRPEGVAGMGAMVFFLAVSLTHDPLFQAPFSMGLSLAFGVAASAPGQLPARRAARHDSSGA